MKQLTPVILCGGAGTRLWPVSRESQPKQFMQLTGGHTLLQETVLRFDGLPPGAALRCGAPIVVSNVEHRFLVAGQLAELHRPQQARIVLEPRGRNTAPALTLAALQALRDARQAQEEAGEEDPDPVLMVMPADHALADKAAFHAALQTAWELAAGGAVVTFGITPSRPETGYGYIHRGAAAGQGAFAVAAFKEKPDAAAAAAMLASGEYLWNSGMFMLRASVWLRAIGHFNPGIERACAAALGQGRRETDFIHLDAGAFAHCPSDSIDYAVMEPLSRGDPALPDIPLRAVPLAAGWSDVGSWDAVWGLLPRDGAGNATTGAALLLDSRDSLAYSSQRLVVGVGLEHLAVIETPDAILVIDLRKAQDVKTAVARLREAGHALADTHRKVHRPWGWYDSYDHGERFQVKRIMVNPGARLSLQLHRHRAEHWVVVRGTAEVTNGERTFLLHENESTYIPLGHVHRLANPGTTPLEIIEVQSGDYLGEDDIVRLEDSYGRVAAVPS